MKLNANIIFDNLPSEMNARYLGEKETTLHLLRPEFYERTRDLFYENHVYLIRAEDLPSKPHIEAGCLILLLGESPYLSRYTDICTLILISSTIRLPSLFNTLTRIYDRFDCWEEKLHQILNGSASLSEMIARSWEIFEAPIIILNSSFHHLAHSDLNSNELTEQERKRWGQDTKELPLETLNVFMSHHEMSTHVKEPLLIQILDTTTLNVNLFKNGEYAGCVSIDYTRRRFRDSYLALAAYLASQVELALRRYNSTENEQSAVRQALQAITDGYQASLSQRRTVDTSYLQQEHVCIKIKFRNTLVQIPVRYLCNAIESNFRRSVALEYDGSIVGFIEISPEQAQDRSYLALLKKRLSRMLFAMDCSVGISDPFQDIYNARLYYFQASAALENGSLFSPKETLFPFQEYALRELIINAVGSLPIEMYYTDGMRKLSAHDETSTASYIETLCVYLDNNMNATKTAAVLFINRSTLLERLERIRKILNMDLQDPEVRLRIQLLLKAEQFHKELSENR